MDCLRQTMLGTRSWQGIPENKNAPAAAPSIPAPVPQEIFPAKPAKVISKRAKIK